jgi:hypothetical protein
MAGQLMNNESERIWKEEITKLVRAPATLQVRIQEVISWNLGGETGYTD